MEYRVFPLVQTRPPGLFLTSNLQIDDDSLGAGVDHWGVVEAGGFSGAVVDVAADDEARGEAGDENIFNEACSGFRKLQVSLKAR